MFDVLDELGRGIKALHALDLDGVSDDELSELVVGLRRKAAALEAATARVTGVWDARGVWTLDGARSGGAWLAHKTRTPGGVARRQVRLAREVRTMPAAERVWEDGAISSEHVSRLAAVRNERTREAFERDEAMLVGHATTLSFRHFERALTYWEQHADPDGAEDHAERLHRHRSAFCSRGFNGGWHLDAHLDPIAGTEVHTALERIERELFETDWAAAKAEHGEEVALDKLARTPTQRRADALVEMARRAMSAPPDAKRPRPLVTFLVNYDHTTLGRVCELANGTVVTPGQVARVIRDADIERAVFNPKDASSTSGAPPGSSPASPANETRTAAEGRGVRVGDISRRRRRGDQARTPRPEEAEDTSLHHWSEPAEAAETRRDEVAESGTESHGGQPEAPSTGTDPTAPQSPDHPRPPAPTRGRWDDATGRPPRARGPGRRHIEAPPTRRPGEDPPPRGSRSCGPSPLVRARRGGGNTPR